MAATERNEQEKKRIAPDTRLFPLFLRSDFSSPGFIFFLSVLLGLLGLLLLLIGGGDGGLLLLLLLGLQSEKKFKCPGNCVISPDKTKYDGLSKSRELHDSSPGTFYFFLHFLQEIFYTSHDFLEKSYMSKNNAFFLFQMWE